MDIKNALEKLLKFFGAIQAAKDEESAGGSKITLMEYPGLAISAVGLIPVFSAIKEVGESVDGMTDEEKEALVNQFKEEFDIQDEATELKIERLFEWVVETSDMIFDLKDIGKAVESGSQPEAPGNPDDK